MPNPADAFGREMHTKRRMQNLTQKDLAEKLHMSVRTVIQTERGQNSPRFETVAIFAQELGISLDAILFPDSPVSTVPKVVVDYFSGKSAAEAQKYIDLCRQADLLKEAKDDKDKK